MRFGLSRDSVGFAAPVSFAIHVLPRQWRLPFLTKQLSCPVNKPSSPLLAPIRMATSGAELRNRIATVQSAEKIVSALRLVAAARIRASSNAALRARPFADRLQNLLAELVQLIVDRRIDMISAASSVPPFSINDMHGPFLADPNVQKALLDRMYLTILSSPSLLPPARPKSKSLVTIVTVIAADRKFCGSYNKDILSRAAMRIRQLESAGSRVHVVLVGRIARTYIVRQFPHLHICLYIPVSKTTAAEQTATTLSHTLLSEFIAGGVQRVEIVYTRFISLISSAPSTRTLLPLTPTGIEPVGDELFQLTITSRNGRIVPIAVQASAKPHNVQSNRAESTRHKLYAITDEEAVLLLNSMLPMYFTSQLIRIVREAIASEQVNRLTAMTAATDNARDLISGLRRKYNRERQARITTEIIEVISSATS